MAAGWACTRVAIALSFSAIHCHAARMSAGIVTPDDGIVHVADHPHCVQSDHSMSQQDADE
jgi:hypothetical protein